jgi:hypothetical protein
LQAAQTVSARGAFFRASTYYQAAAFYVKLKDVRFARLSQRSQELGNQVAGPCEPPIEVLEIPFGAHKLPGYFLSRGSPRRPALVALGGFDSTGEDLIHWIGFAAAERGWNCLILEGPGQRSALRDDPALLLRHDYEVPVKAAIDYAVSRADVDGSWFGACPGDHFRLARQGHRPDAAAGAFSVPLELTRAIERYQAKEWRRPWIVRGRRPLMTTTG